MAAVAPKLEPTGKHDAAFLARRLHVTGDIDILEMDFDAFRRAPKLQPDLLPARFNLGVTLSDLERFNCRI